MDGGGRYNEFAYCQIEVFNQTQSSLLTSIESLNQHHFKSPLIIADLGASQGRNSLPVLELICSTLSAHKKREFLIFSEDLPENDWKSLIETQRQSNLTSESAIGNSRAYFSFIGNSFFHRLFPENFVHCFVSNISLHWLSSIPCRLPPRTLSHVQLIGDTLNSDSLEIHEQWKVQAHSDLFNFLTHRAVEMKDHAQLCFTLASRNEFDKSRHDFYKMLFDTFNELIELKEISMDEAGHIFWPYFLRSENEIRDVISQREEDFRLNELRSILIEYDFEKLARESAGSGSGSSNSSSSSDVTTHPDSAHEGVKRLVDFFMCTHSPSIRSQLISWGTCSPERSQEVCDAFKKALIRGFVREKLEPKLTIHYTFVSLTRKSRPQHHI